jgi:hypothetical protein
MTAIINGSSPTVTFSDGTTQASSSVVLQVVNATTTTSVSNATNTYADTGITATITPKFSTSKILVLINIGEAQKTAANANNDMSINLVRNGTQIVQLTQEALLTGTAIALNMPLSFQYYDSPASTSALTYKCQFKNNDNNGASVQVQVSSVASTITLMEISQ